MPHKTLNNQFGVGAVGFVEAKGIEADSFGELTVKARGKIHQQVLAGRLVGDGYQLGIIQFAIRRAFGYNEGMVEEINDMLLHQMLYVSIVHHHALLRVVRQECRTICICVRLPLYGDKKFVVVSVDIAALAIIAPQGMGHLEMKLFC